MGLLEILSEAMQRQASGNSESLNYENLTQEYILQIARSHLQIFQAVEHWRRGNVTWEQATYLMIIALVEAKVNISDEHLKLLDRTPPAPIRVSDEACKRLGIEPIKLSSETEVFEEAVNFCDSELRNGKFY